MNTPTHAYFLFIGDGIDALDKKSIRFVVETPFESIKNESLFSGKVIARNKNSHWPIGHKGDFIAPMSDVKRGISPSFVRVPRSYVEEKFPEHGMTEEPKKTE